MRGLSQAIIDSEPHDKAKAVGHLTLPNGTHIAVCATDQELNDVMYWAVVALHLKELGE